MIVSQRSVALINQEIKRNELRALLGDQVISLVEFSDLPEFLSQHVSVDCLVFELSELQTHRQAFVQRVLSEAGHPDFILTCQETEVSSVVDAMQLGAVSVLQWPVPRESFAGALLQGIEHAVFRREHFKRQLVFAEKICSLTQREREVFGLLVAGMHVKQIAMQLGIDGKTVHTFRSHIMKKLSLDSNAEIIRAVALTFGATGIANFRHLTSAQSPADLVQTDIYDWPADSTAVYL